MNSSTNVSPEQVGIHGQLANFEYCINQFTTMIDSLTMKYQEIEKKKKEMEQIIADNPDKNSKELGQLVKHHVFELLILDKMIKECKEAKDI